jgi:hypothetical protein
MENSEREDFLQILIATGEMYEKRLSTAVLGLYWESLKDLSIEQVSRGISIHANSLDCKFIPKPGDIRKAIAPRPKDPLIAWRLVEESMGIHGCATTVRFEDGTINAVIRDMGGWPWICMQALDPPWIQKEFERRYAAYRNEGIRFDGRLIGTHESDNLHKGITHWEGKQITGWTSFIFDDGGCKALPPGDPENEPPELTEVQKLIDGVVESLPK